MATQFKSEIILEKYGVTSRVSDYLDLIGEYNKKVNIVSRETTRQDLIRICADCLIPFEFIEKPSGNFIDIGSGGGFPSIVIMLAFSSLKGTLIERTNKKERFLIEASQTLKLNIHTYNQNFIEYKLLNSNRFDFATMKLVRPDSNMFKHLFSLLKNSGRFIYYAPLDNLKFTLPKSISAEEYSYYLDDPKRLRKLVIFSKKS